MQEIPCKKDLTDGTKSAKKRKRDFRMLYLCTCKSETGTALRATRPIYFVRVFDKFALVNRRRNVNKENREKYIYLFLFIDVLFLPNQLNNKPTKQQNYGTTLQNRARQSQKLR